MSVLMGERKIGLGRQELHGEWTVKFVIISREYAFDRQSITGITSIDSAYK